MPTCVGEDIACMVVILCPLQLVPVAVILYYYFAIANPNPNKAFLVDAVTVRANNSLSSTTALASINITQQQITKQICCHWPKHLCPCRAKYNWLNRGDQIGKALQHQDWSGGYDYDHWESAVTTTHKQRAHLA